MTDLVDRDGNVVRVDDLTEAQAAVASGKLGLRADREVNLVNADGRVAVLDDATAAAELLADPSSGYRMASDDEVAADIERAEYSDVGSKAGALVEGALSGPSLGAYDVAVQSGLLGDEFAADSQKRAKHSPGYRTAGEVGGIIGTSLLTGGATGAATGAARGAGLAARGAGLAARAVSAPGRAALALGRGAEGLAARAVGQGGAGLVGKAAAKGLQMGVGGAVEGGIFGAGQQVSQTALDRTIFENPDLAAERIALGAKDGALMGGIIGGGTGTGIGAAQSAAGSLAGVLRGAANRVRGRRGATGFTDEAGEFSYRAGNAASESAEEQFTRRYTYNKKVMESYPAATDADAAALARLTPDLEPSTFGKRATAAERLDDVQQDTIRQLTKQQDTIAVAQDANRQAFSVAEKPEVIRGLISKGRGPAGSVRKPAMAKLADMEERVQSLVARADDFESGGRSAIRQLGRSTENSASLFDDALKATKGTSEETVQVFQTLDRYKKLLGDAQVASSRGANGSQAAMREIQVLREDMRGFLESADVFGEGIAGFQRELNKPWSSLIDISSAFEYRFGTGRQGSKTLSGLKSAGDMTKVISEADPKRISGLVKGLGRAETEKLEGLYRLKLARELEYQKAAHKLFGGGPDVAKNVASIEDASRKSLGALDDARATTADADAFEATQERLRAIPLAGETVAKGRASAGRAAAFTETVEETVEETYKRSGERAVSGYVDAAGSYRKGAAVSQAEAGQSSVRVAADGVLGRVKGAAKAAGRTGAKAATAARHGGIYMGVQFKSASDAAAYQRLSEHISAISDPESDERRAARDQMAPVSAVEPGLARGLEALTQRQADYLASKVRPTHNQVGDGTFSHTRPPRVSPADVMALKNAVERVESPQAVLDRAAGGELRRDDVEALKAVYPAVYEDLRQTVMDGLSEAKELPAYQDRVQLGMLLDLPTDPTLEPGFIARTQQGAQQANAAQEQQGGGGGQMKPAVTPGNAKAPSKTAEMYGTRTERLAGG